uniref:Uncharacterized protein n=1 Tax=viral metagenome TaxID=1070528 RepID=A0A6C0JR91_9ZZZZ
MTDYAYIYCISFYDSANHKKRDKASTWMHFTDEKHTRWVYERWCQSMFRIDVLRVAKDCSEHKMALKNSALHASD